MRRRVGSKVRSRPAPWRGTKPMEGEGDRSRQRRRSQRTRQRSKASRSRVAAQHRQRESAEVQRRGGNGHGDVVRLLEGGLLRGVWMRRRESPERTGPRTFGSTGAVHGSEKRCEPLPVPGCNKPGSSNAEETVEVVRNHEGGTSRLVATSRPTVTATSPGVDAVGGHRRRGTPRGESHERQGVPRSATSARRLASEPVALKVNEDHEGPSALSIDERGAREAKTLGTQPETVKGREGSSKGTRAASERAESHHPTAAMRTERTTGALKVT
jgi:hypothetical protein